MVRARRVPLTLPRPYADVPASELTWAITQAVDADWRTTAPASFAALHGCASLPVATLVTMGAELALRDASLDSGPAID